MDQPDPPAPSTRNTKASMSVRGARNFQIAPIASTTSLCGRRIWCRSVLLSFGRPHRSPPLRIVLLESLRTVRFISVPIRRPTPRAVSCFAVQIETNRRVTSAAPDRGRTKSLRSKDQRHPPLQRGLTLDRCSPLATSKIPSRRPRVVYRPAGVSGSPLPGCRYPVLVDRGLSSSRRRTRSVR